ncbi:MAG: hypothetical protein ACK56F_25370 [bacterium]
MWILAHRCPPPPIGNADQTLCANNMFCGFFFRVRSAIPIGAGCVGAPLYWWIVRKMNVFCAPRLFSSQLPIN